MVVSCSHCGVQYTLSPEQAAGRAKVTLRCTKCGKSTVVELDKASARTTSVTAAAPTASVKAAPAPASPSAKPAPAAPPGAAPAAPPTLETTRAAMSSGLSLPKDKTITISVIGGPAKGLKHVLAKPRIVVGRAGGGADIELSDPEVSRIHCQVEVNQDVVRLQDLNSTNGTFVNEERVQQAELDHLSEFRAGSSFLLVTILEKHE